MRRDGFLLAPIRSGSRNSAPLVEMLWYRPTTGRVAAARPISRRSGTAQCCLARARILTQVLDWPPLAQTPDVTRSSACARCAVRGVEQPSRLVAEMLTVCSAASLMIILPAVAGLFTFKTYPHRAAMLVCGTSQAAQSLSFATGPSRLRRPSPGRTVALQMTERPLAPAGARDLGRRSPASAVDLCRPKSRKSLSISVPYALSRVAAFLGATSKPSFLHSPYPTLSGLFIDLHLQLFTRVLA